MNFVYYRLPHTQQVFRGVMRKGPEELASLAELNGRRGFVIAPFAPSDDCPILLLDVEWKPTSPKNRRAMPSTSRISMRSCVTGRSARLSLPAAPDLPPRRTCRPLRFSQGLAVVILVCLWLFFPRNAAARGSLPLQRCSFAVGVTR